MEVYVNQNCIACGLCASQCPDIFRMTDEGPAAAKDVLNAEEIGRAREAADSCPVGAIRVKE